MKPHTTPQTSREVNSCNEVPLENPFDVLLGYQVRRASAAIMVSLNRELETLNISITEATLLTLIRANPGCSQSDLGRALGIQRTNIAPLVKNLMLADTLKRETATGRTLSLFLTQKGKTLEGKVQQAIARHEERIMRDIPTVQQQQTLTIIRQLSKNALGL